MRRLVLLAGVLLGLAAAGSARAGPLDTLDKFCGGALSSPGCVQTVAEFPLETGAVVAIIEAAKSHISSEADCKTKLGKGADLYNDVAPYLGTVGVDASKVLDCSCTIAFSTQTCSGEATKIANDAADAIGKALSALDSLLGLDVQSDQTTYPQEEENYYRTVYHPLVPNLIGASPEEAEASAHTLYKQCVDDWFNTDVYEVPLCLGFKKRFLGEISALHNQYEAFLAGQKKAAADKLQAQADKLRAQKDAQQKAQDTATDYARKIAMSWAKIKVATYVPHCHDESCINGVTVVAFVYYGKLATGMQDLNSSNTQVLSAANAQFEPIFKEEISKDKQRWLAWLSASGLQLSVQMTSRSAHGQKVEAVRSAVRAKLMMLGVRNPDLVLKRAAILRARHIPVRGLTTSRISVRPLAQ